MKFYDTLDYGISQEINRICGSNETSYPFKAKAARLNAALDRYFSLAFESDGRWSFDDINNTTSPIVTQTLTSGDNEYKLSAFTEEILSLIKLCVLDSDGNEYELIPERIDDLSASFLTLYDTSDTGTPTYYLKYGEFIYLRPTPDYTKALALRAYSNLPASKFNFTRFTVTIAAPGVFSATAHGLSLNDTVMLETDGALPTGLSIDTVYYVVSGGLGADAFEVSATQGGTAITTTGSQSGNHSFLRINKEPGVPSIHHTYLARYASMPFLIENNLSQMANIAALTQQDEDSIKKFFSRRSKDDRPRLLPLSQDNR